MTEQATTVTRWHLVERLVRRVQVRHPLPLHVRAAPDLR